MKLLSGLIVFFLFSNLVFGTVRDGEGLTPLHLASGQGNRVLVQKLLKSGADVFALDSKMGISVLHKAVYSGKDEIVEDLLKAGALINLQSPSNGDTPLHDALYFRKGRDLSMIKTLLRYKPNLSVRNKAGLTPLESAKILKHDDILLILNEEIQKRQSAESKDLMSAIREKNQNEVEKILSRIDQSVLSEVDEQGFSPLLWASREGLLDIVKSLLNAGSNPNQKDQWMGANSGHKAAFWGRHEVLPLLIKAGLKINARGDYNGYTPLHDAIAGGHIEAVRVLLEAGAKKDIRGHDGKTPIDLAKDAKNLDILLLLSEWKLETKSKIQLGYLNQDNRFNNRSFVKPLGFTPKGMPDGSLPLKTSIERGFDLPYTGNLDELTYYLKYYQYPTSINSFTSTHKILNQFHINETKEGLEIEQFAKSRDHVFVKVGEIRETDLDLKDTPLKPFFSPNDQNFFDDNVFYVTLYIEPDISNDFVLDQDKVDMSILGVRKFREEMIHLYQSRFTEVTKPESSERVFLSVDQDNKKAHFYHIPNNIITFSNVRERPRKPGPNNSYGSGLLLIKKVEYEIDSDAKITKVENLKNRTKTWMLEIGSLVQLGK